MENYILVQKCISVLIKDEIVIKKKEIVIKKTKCINQK